MRMLSAELIKLKGTLTYLLPLVIVGFACVVVGAAMTMDVHQAFEIGRNPWQRMAHGAMVVYAIMLYSPFLILLVSAMLYVEQRANAWKLLYVMPVHRGRQYFSKLLALLLLVVGTALLMLVGLVVTGYLVNFWLPEYGFNYNQPEWAHLIKVLWHAVVSGLGVLGLQYLLAVRFGHFLVALGIGVLGFVLAFILAATDSRFALCLPYAYPMIAQDLDSLRYAHRTFPVPGLSNAELYSMGWFVVTVGLGYAYTRFRNVY